MQDSIKWFGNTNGQGMWCWIDGGTQGRKPVALVMGQLSLKSRTTKNQPDGCNCSMEEPLPVTQQVWNSRISKAEIGCLSGSRPKVETSQKWILRDLVSTPDSLLLTVDLPEYAETGSLARVDIPESQALSVGPWAHLSWLSFSGWGLETRLFLR